MFVPFIFTILSCLLKKEHFFFVLQFRQETLFYIITPSFLLRIVESKNNMLNNFSLGQIYKNHAFIADVKMIYSFINIDEKHRMQSNITTELFIMTKNRKNSSVNVIIHDFTLKVQNKWLILIEIYQLTLFIQFASEFD